MPLLVLEYPGCKVRAAIDTDKMLDDLDADDDVISKTMQAQSLIRDFLKRWHSAEDRSKVPLPPWVIYVHVDEEITAR